MDLETIISYPKIDLHRHLDGDIRPEVIFQLAEKDGVPLPVEEPSGLATYFQSLKDRGLEPLFTKGFGLVTSLLQSEENLELAAYEEVRNLAVDGIVYGEIRFAPQYHTGTSTYYGHQRRTPLTYREIIAAVHSGLERGERDFAVPTRLIISIGREVSPEEGVAVAQGALDSMDLNVVAVDLACDEANFPPEIHLPAYELTFDTDLGRTVHAGECTSQPESNMDRAVDLLQAHRISHAIDLHKHLDLQEKIRAGEVALEMCPASNHYCGFIETYRDLHLDRLVEAGLLVSIHSDDPAMFGFTLSESLATLLDEYSWGEQELRRLQLNALEGAFLEDREKGRLRGHWEIES